MQERTYKGFTRDLKCRDFQYEEGKTYEHEGKTEICESGFHSCERPIDVFSYYAPGESVYHEVEAGGEISRKEDGDDTKLASSKIKIGARVDIAGMVKASIEYTKSHCTMEHTDPKLATAGDNEAAIAGEGGSATAGDYGAATAGESGAATAGDYGAATAGYKGAATSRGKSAVGENGIACARGNNVRVKGGLGAILVIAEENSDNYIIKEWKAFVIDGDTYKPDTWYMLKDGEIIEVDPARSPGGRD